MLFRQVVRLFLLFLVCFASLATSIVNFGTLGHLKEFHSEGSTSATAHSHHTHGDNHEHYNSKATPQKTKEQQQANARHEEAGFKVESHGHSLLEFPVFISIRKTEALAVIFLVAFFAVLANFLFPVPIDFSRLYSFLKPRGDAPPPSMFRNLPLLN